MAVTRDPIFVAREICYDFDFSNLNIPQSLRDKIKGITLGQEQEGGGCSMNTKVILIEPKTNEEIFVDELEMLRAELLKQKCPVDRIG